MAQQTAVEFLRSRLIPLIDFASVEERKKFSSIIEQAKAMEKEQIVNAHFEGWSDAYEYLKDDISAPRQAIDYYNETYKK
jgi:hypothetical protein